MPTGRQRTGRHSPWSRESENPQPLTIHDVAADESLGDLRDIVLEEGIRALAFVPLVAAGRLIGKFMLYYDQPHEFGEAELQRVQALARDIAVEIERRNAERQLRFSRDHRSRLAQRADGITVQDAYRASCMERGRGAAFRRALVGGRDALEQALGDLGPTSSCSTNPARRSTSSLPGRRVFVGEPTVEAVVGLACESPARERWSRRQGVRRSGRLGRAALCGQHLPGRDGGTPRRATRARHRGASTVLGASLEVKETMQQLAVLVVPRLADWCLVHLLRDGEIEPVATLTPIPRRCGGLRSSPRATSIPAPTAKAGSRPCCAAAGPGDQRHHGRHARRGRRGRRAPERPRNAGMNSAMIVPIPAAGQTVGAVTFVVDSDPVRGARPGAGQATGGAGGLAIDNARAHEAERGHGRRRAPAEGSRRSRASPSSASAPSRARSRRPCSRDARCTQADRATLLLLDEEAGELRIHRRSGSTPEVAAEVRVPVGWWRRRKNCRTGRPARDRRPQRVPCCRPLPAGARRLSCGSAAPCRGKGRRRPPSLQRPGGRFGPQDTELLFELAERVALVIEQTSLWEREHTMAETLQRSFASSGSRRSRSRPRCSLPACRERDGDRR